MHECKRQQETENSQQILRPPDEKGPIFAGLPAIQMHSCHEQVANSIVGTCAITMAPQARGEEIEGEIEVPGTLPFADPTLPEIPLQA